MVIKWRFAVRSHRKSGRIADGSELVSGLIVNRGRQVTGIGNPVEGTCAAGQINLQVVEVTIRSNIDVAQITETGRKCTSRPSCGIQDVDPPITVISKEVLAKILTREFLDGRVVKSTADN